MTADADDSRTERRAWIVWGGLVAVAVGVYEVFQQPALLGATISLKFAWGDARTGWWLWTRDPNRRRGRAHFWVYAGFGLWKAAIAGIALSFAFLFLHNALVGAWQKPQGKQDETLTMIFAGSCVSGLSAAVASGLVTSVGIVLGYRAGAKVWLNSAVAAARVRDLWPPDFGERNQLSAIALPSAFTTALSVLGLLVVGLLVVFEPQGWGKDAVAAAVLGFIVALTFGALKLMDWTKNHLIAYSPVDAWPDEDGNGP
jgi:hypothetical protein